MTTIAKDGRFFDAHVSVPRSAFEVDVAIGAGKGEVVAVIGPNGSGKSTVLQAIAGLIHPRSAQIALAGRVLADRNVAVPAHRRRIGLMGQDPLLFPHLTAQENVAFGPRSQGRRRSGAAAGAWEWLERLGLGEFAARRPGELSGGQQQRVALARALAAEPDLLLLDEPLAAADVRTAGELRQLLREHLRAVGQTTVVVTHDVLDAAVLADHVLMLHRGRVVDAGATARMLTRPGTDFGAALAGLNLMTGTVDGASAATLRTDGGLLVTGIAEQPLTEGDGAAAVFPPSAAAVYPADAAPVGSPRNRWSGRVTTIEPGPTAVRLRIDLHAAAAAATVAVDVTPAAVAALPLAPGTAVTVEVKATQVRLYPHRPAPITESSRKADR